MGKFVLILLWVCSFAWADQTAQCARELVGLPRTFVPVDAVHPRLDVLAGIFNPSSDVLYFFHSNGHGSLYFADYFWDWSGAYTMQKDPKSLPDGMFVRIRVGAAKIAELVRSTEAGEFHKIQTPSCHHNQILFLHHNGIRLRNQIPVLGPSLCERILQEGFVDADGKAFPEQQVFLIRHREYDSSILNSLRIHNVQIILGVMQHYGLPKGPELEEWLLPQIEHEGFRQVAAAFLAEPTREATSSAHFETLSRFFLLWERNVLSSLEQSAGDANAAVWKLATERDAQGQLPIPEHIRAGFLKEVVVKTIREFVP